MNMVRDLQHQNNTVCSNAQRNSLSMRVGIEVEKKRVRVED
jgi:hypothetical protein